MSKGTTTTSFRFWPPKRKRYHRAVAKLDPSLDLSTVVRDYLDQLAEEQLGPEENDEQYAADLAAENEARERDLAARKAERRARHVELRQDVKALIEGGGS